MRGLPVHRSFAGTFTNNPQIWKSNSSCCYKACRQIQTCRAGAVDERGGPSPSGGYKSGQGFGKGKGDRPSQPDGGARKRSGRAPSESDHPPLSRQRTGFQGSTVNRSPGQAKRHAGSSDSGPELLRADILSASEWRVLTDLLTRSLQLKVAVSASAQVSPTQAQGAAAAAAPISVADDLAAAAAAAGPGPPSDSSVNSRPSVDAAAPPPNGTSIAWPQESTAACSGAAAPYTLSEPEFLLVLWRIVCTQLGLAPQTRQRSRQPSLGSPLRPPMPPPPTVVQTATAHQSLQAELWPGAAVDPWGLSAGLDSPMDLGREAAAPPPKMLMGSSVMRHRCLQMVATAAARLAPEMSPRGKVTALQLLGRWSAALAVDVSSGLDSASQDAEGELWLLSEPFLAAIAAAPVEAWVSWTPADLLDLVTSLPAVQSVCPHDASLKDGGARGRSRRAGGAKAVSNAAAAQPPLMHAVLTAALTALAEHDRPGPLYMSELVLSAASAVACGCTPPPAWLVLLESELRKQLFLMTAPQAAIILASLEQLPPPSPSPLLSSRKGSPQDKVVAVDEEEGAAGNLLSSDLVATLVEETRGKTAVLDLKGGVDSLRELSRYIGAGLMGPLLQGHRRATWSSRPLPPASVHGPQVVGGEEEDGGGGNSNSTGSGRVRQLAVALLEKIAPRLGECSAQQLTEVLTAAANLHQYDRRAAAAACTTSNVRVGAGASTVSRALAAEEQPQQQPLSAIPRAILEPVARVLLQRIRSRSLSLPQLGSSVAALVSLLASELPAGRSTVGVGRGGLGGSSAAPLLPPAPAAMTALLLEGPAEVLRCVLAAMTQEGRQDGTSRYGSTAEPTGGGGSGALGPVELVWLQPLESSFVTLEDELLPRLPLLRQVLLQRQVLLKPTQRENADNGGIQAGAAATAAVTTPSIGMPGFVTARGLVARVMSEVQAGLQRLPWSQLLQLAAAAQHPLTAGLFTDVMKRDLLLAVLDSLPLPSPQRNDPRRAHRLPVAAAALLLPGVVQSLQPAALVAVICAASRRQRRNDDRNEPPQQQQRTTATSWRQWQPPAEAVAAAILSSALSRLLDMALPNSLPRFMDAPDSHGARDAAILSAAQWLDAVAAVSHAAHALAPPPPLSKGSAVGGASAADKLTLTQATLLQLLNAIVPIWPTMSASQAVAMLTHLADLHGNVQMWTNADARATMAEATRGSVDAASARSKGSSVASEGPTAADWHVVQRAVAAVVVGMTEAELVAMVVASARLAAVAPLCDEWMEALTTVLMSPPPPPAPLSGGLPALHARSSLQLLQGCADLKAVALDIDGVMLPVLPLLEQLCAGVAAQQYPEAQTAPLGTHATAGSSGDITSAASREPPPPTVSCSEICRLLSRVAPLATEPALAAIIGTSALPLLGFLQSCAFSGARLGDLLAALQGMARLLLRPSPDLSAALCTATQPLLAHPATSLTDMAALSYAMAQAWLLPTPEWHAALMATTKDLMIRGGATAAGASPSGASGSRKAQALEQLLWAQALWSRRGGGDGEEGGGGLRAPGGWLELLAATAVPLLPGASSQVLSSMMYAFNSLGHDPGPDFVAALLRGCTTLLAAFTGPQLSRLSYGLVGLGYQPEDPWVSVLQLRAAQALSDCDPHELADMLEGVLLLEEGREKPTATFWDDDEDDEDEEGGNDDDDEGGGGGADKKGAGGSEVDDAVSSVAADLEFLQGLGVEDVGDLELPAVEMFLLEFWDVTVRHLSSDAVLLSEAVTRQARRRDLHMVERLKEEFRDRTTDPTVGPFWRYWTEQVPILDPSVAAPDEQVAAELSALDLPMFNGATTDADTLSRLQRFLVWTALRTGSLPRPLPEGVSPWVGLLAARCLELLSGPRSAAALNEPKELDTTGKEKDGMAKLEGFVQLAGEGGAGSGAVRVAPPVEWVSVLLLSQAGAMLLGGGAWTQRRLLLQAAQAAVVWAAPPLAEWGEAFLRASRTAFLGGNGEGGAGGHAAQGAAQTASGDGTSAPEEMGTGGSTASKTPPTGRVESECRETTPSATTDTAAAAAAAAAVSFDEGPLLIGELLQMLMAVLSLDLAPGTGWLVAAEAASLPLLRGCSQEEAVALALVMQRLGHEPGREWAAELLKATRPAATPTAASRGRTRGGESDSDSELSAVSVAALVVCLSELRVRPSHAWMDDALGAIQGRQGELPAGLRARLLAAVKALEVHPVPEWLAPVVENFWCSLEELLLEESQGIGPLVEGLTAISALDVPVKQGQLTALLVLLARRLGLEEGKGWSPGAVPAGASATAADIARVLICLAGMRRATPSRTNRTMLDAIFTVVAERLPLSGPLTPTLLDSWDKLVPM